MSETLTWRNVYQYSTDVPETRHDGHVVELTEPIHVLDAEEPVSFGAIVRCAVDGETFFSFAEELGR